MEGGGCHPQRILQPVCMVALTDASGVKVRGDRVAVAPFLFSTVMEGENCCQTLQRLLMSPCPSFLRNNISYHFY